MQKASPSGCNGDVLRSINAAIREANIGNYDRALSICIFAKSLCTNQKSVEYVEALTKKLLRLKAVANDNSKSAPTMDYTKIGSSSKNNNSGTSQMSKDSEYTSEQLKLVNQVNTSSSLYDILRVSPNATKNEINKAYRRQALLLHPDKNHAPGAVEAFHAISKAFQILSDKRKRRTYDIECTQSNLSYQNFSYGNPRRNTNTNTNFDDYNEDAANEIFNLFFENQRRPYQYANQRQPTYSHHHQSGLAIALILVLVLTSLLSSFFTSDPVYSLTQTSKYSVKRETQHLSIVYYVKENFADDYKGTMGRLEHSVEEDYIYTMKQNCFHERSYRQAMMAQARTFGKHAKFVQAEALDMPSCINLSKLGIRRYTLY